MVAGWNPFFFKKHRFHILHFPNSTRLFTKPTGHHYTKYRFSPDIAGGYCFLSNFFFIKGSETFDSYSEIKLRWMSNQFERGGVKGAQFLLVSPR